MLLSAGTFVLYTLFVLDAAGPNALSVVLLVLALTCFIYNLVASCLSATDKTISLNFSVYSAFLLIVPGIYHTQRGYYPFFDYAYTPSEVFEAALITCLFSVAFLLGNNLKWTESGVQVNDGEYSPIVAIWTLWFLSLLCGIAAGPSTLFVKRSDLDTLELLFTPTYNILLWTARMSSFISLLLSVVWAKRGRLSAKKLITLVSVSVLFLATNYPPGMPRTYIFGYAIIVSLLLFDYRKPIVKLMYLAAFLGGTLLLFPAVDMLTRGAEGVQSFDPFIRYLETGDFDGLQSLINICILVRDQGLSLGKNLVSAFLFFIPRWAWEGKSVGTGMEAAEYLQMPFTNVSAPIIGEIYVDFGYLGVIVGGFFWGAGCAKLDSLSGSFRRQGKHLERIPIAFVGGLVFIIARGSLVGIIGPIAIGLCLALAVLLSKSLRRLA